MQLYKLVFHMYHNTLFLGLQASHFLTGDYEFLSKMYGLSGASGRNITYPCLKSDVFIYYTGKCPCSFCLITNDGLQSLLAKIKPKRKTWAPRSLQLLQQDHERFVKSGGDLNIHKIRCVCLDYTYRKESFLNCSHY